MGLIGAWFSIGGEMEIILLTIAAIIGLLIASNLHIEYYPFVILAAFVGLFIGIDSAQDELSGTIKLVTMIGSYLGIIILVLYAMGFAEFFSKKDWQMIGIRVCWFLDSSKFTIGPCLVLFGSNVIWKCINDRLVDIRNLRFNGGQGQNRTADTRIFRLWSSTCPFFDIACNTLKFKRPSVDSPFTLYLESCVNLT